MGEARQNEDDYAQALTQSRDFVEFILARMVSDNVSIRRISMATGITKNRVHAVLHSDVGQRRPMKVDEMYAVLGALGIDQLEASLANDLLSDDSICDRKGGRNIIAMVSEIFRGLPHQIADVIDHIEGIDCEEIRKQHGRKLQAILIETIRCEYTKMAERRASFEVHSDED